MYAKFCVSRETANAFIRLFVNRRAYAIQADRQLPNGTVPYYPAREKNCQPMSGGITPPIVSRNIPAIIKVIAVARNAAA